jgi:hypothetical protein
VKRGIFAAILAVHACGCAVMPEVQRQHYRARIEPILLPDPNGFIQDDRDPKSKISKYLGGLSYDCNFAISVYDSGVGGADRLQRLERDLKAAFQPLPPLPAILHKYSIYHNKAYQATLVQKDGWLSEALIYSTTMPPGEGQRPRCDREKMVGGWFAKSDLSNEYSPLTIDIDITFGGKRYSVTSAYSPTVELQQEAGFWAGGIESVLSQPEWIVSVQEAMKKANTRLIETIKAAAPDAPATIAQ